ncbi:1-aminocyclopropane-1-carboxylate oxidase homolog 1-like [Tripterygium wilfordii]|uniref:1-aminocyclopropane-1-carboxylate oxidase homolog 1-like n=1 Tax=Tripterygium wilfordii TaxID=458696 RepID=UPI0018F7F007|nr:1-aminocyclopropane-1-carboxylate oxidase homolog 1-like [Tripterygium wilfordii]
MPSSFFTINTEQGKIISVAVTAMSADSKPYDRLKDIKAFVESKAGVKGLVDSGITSIPPFFIHPPDSLSTKAPTSSNPNIIPTIDLSGVDSGKRLVLVQQVAHACRELGFFQIVNHGIPLKVMENMIGAIKSFNEQPTEIKSRIYGSKRSVDFGCNIGMLKAATWRDTLRVLPSHSNFEPKEIPEICRDEVLEWDNEVKQVGEVLMGLLCEGLGLENRFVFQILTNDEYKSVEHRVLTNSHDEPRASVAVFFNTINNDVLYGPFEELVSTDKPALYQPFTLSDFMKRYVTEDLGGKSLKNHYRL